MDYDEDIRPIGNWKRHLAFAYLFWVAGGLFGLHRLYLGRMESAYTMFAALLAFVTLDALFLYFDPTMIAPFSLTAGPAILGWSIRDAIRMRSMVEETNVLCFGYVLDDKPSAPRREPQTPVEDTDEPRFAFDS